MSNVELSPMLPPEALPSELPNKPDGLLVSLVKEGSLHMLTLDQRRLLVAELEAHSDSEACRMVGITSQRLAYWRRTNKVFVQAEQAIADGLLMEARARLSSLLPQAADALEDALDAFKTIEVTCPHCGEEHSVHIADQKLRVQVAKELFKRSGDFSTKVRVSVDGEVRARNLTFEDQIALAQLSRGQLLPPDIYQSLLARGLVPTDFQHQGQLVEGEVVEG